MALFSVKNDQFPTWMPESDVLSIFDNPNKKSRSIQPGMDAYTIADILSDRLIELVRKDLQLAVKQLRLSPKRRPRHVKNI